MPTRNVNLTDHFDEFVERQLSSGRYRNASEIIRDALRLLEAREQEREVKLRALRRAAKEGFADIDQGQGIVVRGKKALARLLEDVQTEVMTRADRPEG